MEKLIDTSFLPLMIVICAVGAWSVFLVFATSRLVEATKSLAETILEVSKRQGQDEDYWEEETLELPPGELPCLGGCCNEKQRQGA